MTNSDSGATRLSFSLAATLLVVSGCGDGMARVSGTVTLDGQPVAQTDTVRCEVALKPVGGGPAATGSVDPRGRFRIAVGSSNSVPPGEYAASVRIREVTPPAEPGGYPQSLDLAPDRYANSSNSGLVYALEPGSNQIDIAITSK